MVNLKNWNKVKPEFKVDMSMNRYYNPNTNNMIQVGKYRFADKMDKFLNKSFDWHGKYYIEFMNTGKRKLFNTKQERDNYLKTL